MATLFCLKIQLWCNLSTPLSFCKVPFPPTFMPCDLSEESSLSCYARHPWLCSPSARSSARGTARMSGEPRVGACSSSRGFARAPEAGLFSPLSLAAEQLPQTREGGGLPAPVPGMGRRHRDRQASTGWTLSQTQTRWNGSWPPGTTCPSCPAHRELRSHASPARGMLQALRQPRVVS